jgi:diacylglycerol kinase family enzyme
MKKQRRVAVVLNRGAGTIKGSDPRKIASDVRQFFASAGQDASVKLTTGSGMGPIIERHIREKDVDAVIVGGGDGSISSSAAQLQGTGIALGILPLGTMNLFARSLGMPLTLPQALEALIKAKPKSVDAGFVGDRLFLHQLSFGLHPELVRTREKMTYRSRMGKIFASMKAYARTIRRPKVLLLRMSVDGVSKDLRTPALVISNNLYGGTYLPYADKVDEGILGIYLCTSRRWPDLLKLTADVMLGNWWNNTCVEIMTGRSVRIEVLGRRRKSIPASVDGELVRFTGPIEAKIVPRALEVLMPPKPT